MGAHSVCATAFLVPSRSGRSADARTSTPSPPLPARLSLQGARPGNLPDRQHRRVRAPIGRLHLVLADDVEALRAGAQARGLGPAAGRVVDQPATERELRGHLGCQRVRLSRPRPLPRLVHLVHELLKRLLPSTDSPHHAPRRFREDRLRGFPPRLSDVDELKADMTVPRPDNGAPSFSFIL
jgi:hypothetical protein